MKIRLNEITDKMILCDYNVYREIISETDHYTMYKITRNSCSDLNSILYHCMFYLESGEITPQEIVVNSKTNIIEKITLFVSQNTNYKISIADYCISEKKYECDIILNECTDNWKGRFLKIVKDSSLLWGSEGHFLYFIFSDAPKVLNAYYVSQNCRILVDDYENIQGFSVIQC